MFSASGASAPEVFTLCHRPPAKFPFFLLFTGILPVVLPDFSSFGWYLTRQLSPFLPILAGILPARPLPSCLFWLVSYPPVLSLPASFNWYLTRCISPFCLVQLVPYQPCPTFLLQSTAIQPNHHSPKLTYKSPPYALLQPH